MLDVLNIEFLMALRRINVEGIEAMIRSILGNKKAVVAELIYNKVNLGDGFYFTHRLNKDIIVDTNNGNVYRIDNTRYQSVVYYNEVSVRDRRTGEVQEVLKNGVLDFENVKVASGYTFVGRNNYSAVPFDIPYRINIKTHVIVCAMTNGHYDVLDAVGVRRRKDIHHIKAWKLTYDNSARNLELLTKKEHKERHRKKNLIY